MEDTRLMMGGHSPAASVNVVVLECLPILIAGQTYPMSLWAKLVSGVPMWTFGVRQGNGFLIRHPAVVTSKWTRFTWTMLLPAAYSGAGLLELVAEAAAAGTILVTGFTITRWSAGPETARRAFRA